MAEKRVEEGGCGMIGRVAWAGVPASPAFYRGRTAEAILKAGVDLPVSVPDKAELIEVLGGWVWEYMVPNRMGGD